MDLVDDVLDVLVRLRQFVLLFDQHLLQLGDVVLDAEGLVVLGTLLLQLL